MDALFPALNYDQARIDDLTLNPLSNSGSTDWLITAMAVAMGTDSSGGTSFASMGPGIAQYEANRGVNRTIYTVTNPTLSTLKDLVDVQKVPALGSFTNWSFQAFMNEYQPSIEIGYGGWNVPINHSVAITGYFDDPTSVAHT